MKQINQIFTSIRNVVAKFLKNVPALKTFLYKLYGRFSFLDDLLVSDVSENDLSLPESLEIEADKLNLCYKYSIELNLVYKKIGNHFDIKQNVITLKETPIYQLIDKHFVNKIPWKEIESYSFFKDFLIKRSLFNCTDEKEFLKFLNSLKDYYQQSRNSDLINNKISIGIGRKGEYIIVSGTQYASIAKLIDQKTITVKIKYRHPDWIQIHKDLIKFKKMGYPIYQPFIHPDFNWISTNYSEERFQVIKNNITIKSGDALDIGANFGYFSHKLEDLGFSCYAVEFSSRHAYFIKKFRDIAGKNFRIINKSIFDFTEKNYFDLVLALNIFHHFLKTKDSYENLIELLKRLEMKEMFFQAHDFKMNQMKGAYVNLDPQQFVDFILKYSCLNKATLIAKTVDGRNRPLYRLNA